MITRIGLQMNATANELKTRLRGGVVVLDGAMGTELERRGVNCALPLWSARALLEAPEIVAQIHRDFVSAGAQIVVANTFRTNPRTLERAGLRERGRELSALAIRLAREAAAAAAGPVWVAASVAPVEDCYEPQRVPPDAALADEHAEFVEWLMAGRPDLLWIETMNTVREAVAAATAAKRAGIAFGVSFVLNERGELLSGEPLAGAVEAIIPLEPLAVGVNCIPPAGCTRGVNELRGMLRPSATGLPCISAYAHLSAGGPTPGWKSWQELDSEAYAETAMGWVRAGAAIVGGCCGTTPGHIASVAKSLAEL